MELKNITVTEISSAFTVCSEKGRCDRIDNRKSSLNFCFCAGVFSVLFNRASGKTERPIQ